jgi:hypothetical protein
LLVIKQFYFQESGLTNEEIGKKIGEFVDAVTNETLKAKALEHKATCARLYDLKSSKKRRNVQHHDLESKLRSEWDWLTGWFKSFEIIQFCFRRSKGGGMIFTSH